MNSTRPNDLRCRISRSCNGFTLVEILVTISIIGVLLAITLPILLRTRETAQLITATQYQRQVALNLANYLHDNKQTFPYWGVPGTNDADLYYHGRLVYSDAHWGHPYAWGMYLEDRGYDGFSSGSFGIGGRSAAGVWPNPDRFFHSLHRITHTAYAEPAYFDGELSSQTIDRYRVMRLTDAAFPSEKGVLWTQTLYLDLHPDSIRQTPYIATYCDLHADAPHRSQLRPHIEMSAPGWSFPFAATLDGILGRDI